MKNKINESNKYECVLCETGEGERHGAFCSCNKKYTTKEVNNIMENITKDENLCLARDALDNQYN